MNELFGDFRDRDPVLQITCKLLLRVAEIVKIGSRFN